MRRGPQGALSSSPVLIGAVTVMIAVIAVVIAYGANAGLPFVPTYDLKVDLASGNKLVEGNDVRLGGFRVGVVDQINPKAIRQNGKTRAIAQVVLKLQKSIQPLPADTGVAVRPRSALGLKYVELRRGHAKANLQAGATIPLRNTNQPLEIEDVFSTFQPKTREDIRGATQGFGDAFAGRGRSLNTAIGALKPFFIYLTPVMQNLSNPDTGLDQFFLQLGRSAAQVAPIARVNAQLFTNLATTFAAIDRDPRALQATIEKGPSTQDVAIHSFRTSRPFFADFGDLSVRLRPAVQQLPVSLPLLNTALGAGIPVLPKTVKLNNDLKDTATALNKVFTNPNTLLTLKDLNTALTVVRPAIEYIAPYQTVCDYAVYYLHALGEHQSQLGSDKAGTVQNQGVKLPNLLQPNNYGTTESSRPTDILPGQNAKTATVLGQPAWRFENPIGGPAVDAQGNADCQHGQEGYPAGGLSTGNRYGPGVLSDGTPTGGNAAITDPNYPILSGGTFVTRKLGINNLRDVP